MASKLIHHASMKPACAIHKRRSLSASTRYHDMLQAKCCDYALGPLTFSRTFTSPPTPSLIQTVKKVAALMPELERSIVYSPEHQIIGSMVANAEFYAPEHRKALHAAGTLLADTIRDDAVRRMAQKLRKEKTLLFPSTSMRRSIEELSDLIAEDRERAKSIWTSKERGNFGFMLQFYSRVKEREISRRSRYLKIILAGLTSGVVYTLWQ